MIKHIKKKVNNLTNSKTNLKKYSILNYKTWRKVLKIKTNSSVFNSMVSDKWSESKMTRLIDYYLFSKKNLKITQQKEHNFKDKYQC